MRHAKGNPDQPLVIDLLIHFKFGMVFRYSRIAAAGCSLAPTLVLETARLASPPSPCQRLSDSGRLKGPGVSPRFGRHLFAKTIQFEHGAFIDTSAPASPRCL